MNLFYLFTKTVISGIFHVHRKTEQQEMGHRPRVLVMLVVCQLVVTQFLVETDTSAVASLVTAASLVPLITSLFDNEVDPDLSRAALATCALYASLQRPVTTASSCPATTCPNGWTRYQTSCYLVVTYELETWSGAQAKCVAENSGLVEIETEAENNFLKDVAAKTFLNGQFWTGGNDIDVEGQWRWVTSGNPFTFTDWGPGEPNDTGGNEDCMLLLSNTGYTWNDLPCSTNSLYICEKP
ncbi:perlucin-like protein isoform X2 [Crassostrea angulata]|nr:perlucin-like protein isoform X2 [Crassostrea angulata]